MKRVVHFEICAPHRADMCCRMRRFCLLVVVCLWPGLLRAQDSETEHKPILSPDKNWEYRVVDDTAVLVRAGDDKPAVTISGPDNDGTPLKTRTGTLVWAPDSRRFAFNYRAGGKFYTFDLYELAGTTWKKLPDVSDNDAPVEKLIDRSKRQQLKRLGAKKDANLNSVMETWRVRRWLTNDIFQAYAGSEARVTISESSEDHEYFGAAVLFTGKCDNRGGWKIVDSRLLSEAEDEKISKEDE
jgi:hypothetical protein